MKRLINRPLILYIATFILTTLLFSVALFILRCAPFGNNSLAASDAYIQYIDLFSYFKDVLSGQNDIVYSFDKTLGGNGLAIFSYYLASPLNFLVIFFTKTDLHIFLDLIIIIKLAFSSTACAIFLKNRFSNQLNTVLLIAFSLGYATCSYALTKNCCVMWLDGMCLLPIMALGVYKLIKNDKINALLPIAIGLSILFNWYTGIINCLFICFWFILEFILSQKPFRQVFRNLIKFAICSIIGVALSAAILISTLLVLGANERGGIDWSFFSLNFRSEIPSMVQNLRIGATDTTNEVSLFCGTLSIIAIIAGLISKNTSKKHKIITSISLLVIYLIMCWGPCFFAFSLFKDASSYYTRYAYIGSFALIFLSANSLLMLKNKITKFDPSIFIKAGVIASIMQIILQYIRPGDYKTVCLTVIFFLLTSTILTFYFKAPSQTTKRIIFATLLILSVLAELTINATLIMRHYLFHEVEQYETYSQDTQTQIADIKTHDDSIYRISQTSTGYTYETPPSTGLTANFNESLAYNYMSISGYTSSPDSNQVNFLNHVGYHKNSDNFNIVDTSIIATDSLLGVKYVMSDFDINGLEPISDQKYNNKKTYFNPYYLPIAFDYKYQSDTQIDYNNPFVTVNNIYSQLIGEQTDVFIPASISKKKQSDEKTIYRINIPQSGKYALYGNIKWLDGQAVPTVIKIDNHDQISYSRWLAPSVFYIPYDSNHSSAEIAVSADERVLPDPSSEQFYLLNLELLAKSSAKLRDRSANVKEFSNGHIIFETTERHQDMLYTSIPYDRHWNIRVNGQSVTPELIDGCLMSIPLSPNKNSIELNYSFSELNVGLIVSGLSAITIIVIILTHRRRTSI